MIESVIKLRLKLHLLYRHPVSIRFTLLYSNDHYDVYKFYCVLMFYTEKQLATETCLNHMLVSAQTDCVMFFNAHLMPKTPQCVNVT